MFVQSYVLCLFFQQSLVNRLAGMEIVTVANLFSLFVHKSLYHVSQMLLAPAVSPACVHIMICSLDFFLSLFVFLFRCFPRRRAQDVISQTASTENKITMFYLWEQICCNFSVWLQQQWGLLSFSGSDWCCAVSVVERFCCANANMRLTPAVAKGRDFTSRSHAKLCYVHMLLIAIIMFFKLF